MTGDAFRDSPVTSLEMLVILWINTKIILYITSTPSCTSFSAMIHFKSWDEFSLDEKIFGSWEYKKIYQWGFLSIPGVYVDFFVGVSSIHSHQSRHRRRRRESLVSLMNNFELFILQRFFLHLGSVPWKGQKKCMRMFWEKGLCRKSSLSRNSKFWVLRGN